MPAGETGLSGNVIVGIDEFANQATNYIVFNHLTQTPTPNSNTPTLLEQIIPYRELNLDLFSDSVLDMLCQTSIIVI